jgi:hypothetical protein
MDGGIHVEPNPAQEGGTVTVTASGGGPWYVVNDRTGEINELEMNTEGTATIPVPVAGGETFTVTDFGAPIPNEALVPVTGNR